MKVYKAIHCGEIDLIKKAMNNEIAPSERQRYSIIGYNTFDYEPGIEYIHFFLFAETAWWYWNNQYGAMGEIMQCDIPHEVLSKFLGFGYYNFGEVLSNPYPGYAVPLPEFSIPLEYFKIDYIREPIIDLYNFRKHDIKDWFRNEEYVDYLKNIPKQYMARVNDDGSSYFQQGFNQKSARDLNCQEYMKKM